MKPECRSIGMFQECLKSSGPEHGFRIAVPPTVPERACIGDFPVAVCRGGGEDQEHAPAGGERFAVDGGQGDASIRADGFDCEITEIGILSRGQAGSLGARGAEFQFFPVGIESQLAVVGLIDPAFRIGAVVFRKDSAFAQKFRTVVGAEDAVFAGSCADGVIEFRFVKTIGAGCGDV